jgi:hypothetical protein
MANKHFIVRLTPEERSGLEQLLNKGRAWARKLTHARILLLADAGEHGPALTDQQIRAALSVGSATVERVRRRLVLDGLEAALNPRQGQREQARKIDGPVEAHLIALACGPPPPGRTRWTLQLLADQLVKLELVESVSYETVRQTLKKKRAEALVARRVVPARNGQRRVRLPDGGAADALPTALR